jgi:hypothetical protein
MNDIDAITLESTDTPRHENEKEMEVEVISVKAMSTRERVIEKAKSLFEKIKQNTVRFGYLFFLV